MSEGIINAATRLCAVLGHPIAHSASPAMQNAGFAALGLDWRYLAFDVHPKDLRAAIEGARAMKFIGLNLTVPHKLLALDMVDVVDEKAREWGAVNTIVFEARAQDGAWVPLGQLPAAPDAPIRSHGFNTDADAIVQALKENFQWPELRGASVLLLGAGGAARATALRLAQEGVAALWLINRTEEKAGHIAVEITSRFPGVQIRVAVHHPDKVRELNATVLKNYPAVKLFQGYPDVPVDVVINATSLGLKPGDALPIDLPWLKSRRPQRVYDMIYRPAETALLREAKSAGCRTANGLDMLLYQGARALELWTGRPAPVVNMRSALEKNIYV